jgi:D-alanyl-D-alanine carboxypeptidase
VAAKTGYIFGVVGLTGYVLDQEGRPAVAFSILVNDARNAAAAKKLTDDVCTVLVGQVDATRRPARP